MIYKENWRNRFVEVYNEYQNRTYAQAVRDHGYIKPTWPKYKTANGLTMFIVKFLTYAGWRATRVNTQGRLIKGLQRQPSGTMLTVNKFIPTAGRRGSADISSTIAGKSVQWEIKINDKPSQYQLREQALEQQAGGFYFFIHSPEEFLEYYDKIILPL